MLLRRSSPVAAALLAAAACAPSVPKDTAPSQVDYATFDVQTPVIPLPNDLALTQDAINSQQGAQKAFLQLLANRGGFPNDQEVAVTVPFNSVVIDPNTGAHTAGAPDLDVSSINDQSLAIIKAPGTIVPHDPVAASDYANGVLTLHNVGRKPWDAGAQYIVAVRGGPNGVKTKSGGSISPTPTFFLLTRGVDLSDPANESLIPGADRTEKAATGARLEALRKSYLTPFAIVDQVFPSRDLAVMSTFKIAPGGYTQVQTDPNRGLIPLPSDFLRGGNGNVLNIPAFGPLAPGIATLDGFSTTAPITAQVSGYVAANTVNLNTVLLYEFDTSTAIPKVTRITNIVTEPPQVTAPAPTPTGTPRLSNAIVLQPATPVPAVDASGNPTGQIIALPPLKEDTEYAVLMTTGIKDFPGNQPLQRGTLASLLLLGPENPLYVNGKSTVSVLDDNTANGLEQIRQALHIAIGTATATGVITGRNDVVMGYTFKTQTITGKNNILQTLATGSSTKPAGLLQLAALPYSVDAAAIVGGKQGFFKPAGTPTELTVAQAFAKYGADTTLIPNDSILEFVETVVPTVNLLSTATGAFDPAAIGALASGDASKAGAVLQSNTELLNVLVALPNPQNVTTKCPGLAITCAPLMVFHHGLGGGRDDMLTVANEFTAKGFIVAAIDTPKHGDRSWCTENADCATGYTCNTTGYGTQGDKVTPGICTNSAAPHGPSAVAHTAPRHCGTAGCFGAWAAAGQTAGVPRIWDPRTNHEAYFVSGNFFRTRDSLRQDVLDHQAVVLALAPPIPAPDITTNKFAAALASKGLAVFPGSPSNGWISPDISWTGQSLGSILGTLNIATSDRYKNAALNVGGGTLTDILANSPSFKSSVCALLAGQGITKPYDSTTNGCPIISGKESAYLQFLLVAKWILDPADPINFALTTTGNTLPDPVTSTLAKKLVPVPAKSVLGQAALCDGTIPNPFNAELFLLMGLGPNSSGTSTLPLYGSGNALLPPDTNLSAPAHVSGSSVVLDACPYVPASPLGPNTPFGSNIPSAPHGFITSWGIGSSDPAIPKLTKAAQDEAAAFLLDGTLPPAAVILQ